MHVLEAALLELCAGLVLPVAQILIRVLPVHIILHRCGGLMANSVLCWMTRTRNTPEALLAFKSSCLLLSSDYLSLCEALQLNGLGTALGFYCTWCNSRAVGILRSLSLGLQTVTCVLDRAELNQSSFGARV